MSQSPVDNASPGNMIRYRQGWKALNRLLHEKRSFSGHEKNCAFLNLQDGTFATVGSVSGLDFSDDGRALAICDWDFDGRNDLWMSARTAPRVRLLRNQSSNNNHFLSLRLIGNGSSTNRDAIGARIEVFSQGRKPQVATVRAGDGFLSQSTRWVQFGLGDATGVEQVRIHWPAGEVEEFGPAEADAFYLIQQNSGKLDKWMPPSTSPLVPQPQAEVAPTGQARIVPPYRLPLPTIDQKRATGNRPLEFDQPTLVSIWSATCTVCLEEFSHWAKAKSEFEEHGLQIVAVNADIEANQEQIDARRTVLRKMGFHYPLVIPTQESLWKLNYFQRALMDLWETMPVPCSFLVDRHGQVLSIYKGPVELSQLWSDLALASADEGSIRTAAVPFPGRWGNHAPIADPTRVASQMLDHKLVRGAADYLQQALDQISQTETVVDRKRIADLRFMKSVLLGSLGERQEALQELEVCKALNPRDQRIRTALADAYLKQRDFAKAEIELGAAVEIAPDDLASRRKLGQVLHQQDKLLQAADQLRIVAQKRPGDALAQFQLATVLRKAGEVELAIAAYERTVELRPNFVQAANNLAWILATHPSDGIRDGQRAFTLAQRVCQQTQHKQPTFLGTLAAAAAELGDFKNAVKVMDRVLKLEEETNGNVDAHKLRRGLYLKGQPYREAP